MKDSEKANGSESNNTQDQFLSFQRIWLETIARMMQVALTLTPNSPPPELFRRMRGGILDGLAESWEQYLRSPQFLEAKRQWMDQSVTLRQMGNELLDKVRHEMHAPSRNDIDTVMLAVRHMEKRLLDRVEQLSNQLNELNEQVIKRPRPRKARPAARTQLTPQAKG